jgi:hypothetical protein
MASRRGARAILGVAVLCAGCGSPTPPAGSGTAGTSGAAGTASPGAGGGFAGAAGSETGGEGGAASQQTAGKGGGAVAGAGTGGAAGAGGAAGGTGGVMSAGPFFCSGTILGIADFDGDGTPDCVVTTSVGRPALSDTAYPVFLKGLGYGAYSRTGVVSPIVLFDSPMGLSTVDLSGDGIADLAVASEYAQISVFNVLEVVYLKSGGDGTFTSGSQMAFMAAIGVGWGLAGTGDFNGDGKPDVLLAAWDENETQAVYWLLVGDKGATELSAGFSLGDQGTLTLANVPGDFNSDGKLDVAAALHDVTLAGATVSQDVIMVSGAGDGTFAAPVHVPGTTGASGVSVGDLNGDGKLDLDVSYDAPSSTPVPMYGDGTGNFSLTPP